MKPMRFAAGGVAASAGIIASSSGSATQAPAPRRKVRRGSARLVTIMISLFSFSGPHLKGRALHDAEHERGEAVVASRGVVHDLAHRRLVVILHAAAHRIREQLLG